MEANQEMRNTERRHIESVLSGNKNDYAYLVDRYKNKVYMLLRGMGAEPQDAQDLTQEAFIKAYRKLDQHDPEKSFAAWLYTIAANGFKDAKKRKAIPAALLAEREQDADKGPEEILLLSEEQKEMRHRISKLPSNYRLVLLLRYTNDLNYAEISEIMGCPVSKVQNDLYRARLKLKKMMLGEERIDHEMLEARRF
ncbi:sigma-70 family RNA polymerase sigma factor [Paenibacillus chitinolyticus]|uniref:RNA polymerase sigma factor n=1 Tax=Paenibacillus chitinolyticus TaxID=79263 RepID=UPI002DBDBE09|nr:sigma-70 family RNA polymerase sigma factor [Paenibacillus chitinolyticus]MEC0245492.1 sigma-70 family RNA polymerase sigma factor [Paenibacillus chitinolyticus]